jgi:hypothetical protein
MFADNIFYGCAAYADDPYQTLRILLFGCLLALCAYTMHPAQLCGGFRTIFFCLVCGLLEKGKLNNNNNNNNNSNNIHGGFGSTLGHNFYIGMQNEFETRNLTGRNFDSNLRISSAL